MQREVAPADGGTGQADSGWGHLGEGNTPLVPSRWIGPRLGLRRLYFKLEQTNPTGSYKDRFAARFVARLRAAGNTVCLASSSGNTGAALAAYSAAAGISCVLCVPAEAPAEKLTQVRAYGARLLRVAGMLDGADALRRTMDRLQEAAARFGLPLGVSAYAVAPEAMAGIEPLSAELTAALGATPDRVFCPVGGGGLLVAVWRGFRLPGGVPDGAVGPRLHAVQPALNDTLVGALRAGEAQARTVPPGPATRVSGLGVPYDLDATAALEAVRASGGDGHLVTDEAVWEAQGALARHEGLFVEPAGAAAVAGLWQAVQEGRLGPDVAGERLVCLLTGHGLKDGVAAARLAPDALEPPVATADVAGALDRLLDRR